MTLVNHDTGELVEPLSRADAERLTTRIRLRLDAIADNYVAVMPLIREAIERRAWDALGYSGVSAYVSECFGDALAHLGVEVRREVVRELTEAGMSTRAIAPVVGVSDRQVRYDVQKVGSPSHLPQTPAASPLGEEAGAAGQTSPETPSPVAGETPGEAASRGTAPRPVTGIDGKTYTRPEVDRTLRRKPLTDAYWAATYDLGKKLQTLQNLTADDRWASNKEAVSSRCGSDVLRALTGLADVLTHLDAASLTENEEARQWWLASLSEISEALHDFASTLEGELDE